ncbi:hypothetical protein N7478_004226 [Penicillium angulare]|uniref:uncharacterized protein n=1 Tax=Penicillium angulare TaxID=116970 RepID=UPI002541DC07|nr:uncharacterized protein N7478_004226 [Penicillium angulare]KAJ5278854.1 hypothetical protein N7478_004226 [Penicillium angulare]
MPKLQGVVGLSEAEEKLSDTSPRSESEPDIERASPEKTQSSGDSSTWNWDEDPSNPYNWPTKWKVQQILMIASAAFTTSVGVSILTPAHTQFMEEFQVSGTVAIVPLSLYVFALGLGPIVGGPLSETIGRYPVYIGTTLLGSLFTLGVGFSKTFAGICVLRFLSGFCFAPSLAIAAGTINETFKPIKRAIPPVIGSFVVARKGWEWTQWTLLFFAIFTMITILTARETFHPVLKHRRAKELGLPLPPSQPLSSKARLFATVALLRPIQMLLTEPIVAFVCLYVACEFATLFCFFAAVPLVFGGVYGFGLEDSGLVFLAIVVGCLLGVVTVLLCDVFLYRRKAAKLQGRQVPAEFRLYPALIGSIGLPIGLFWFGWTAKASINWASPTVAIMLFAWGNLCVFVSTTQYIVDTYHGLTVASAMSANSLARYGLAAAFPLFTVQSKQIYDAIHRYFKLTASLVFTKLDIGWASSLLGFIAIALLPVPWVFFLTGKRLRALSKFEVAEDSG